ncbi:ketopantoate reductase PanE/ApbA C terminal-domain-containing protein [Plectosphaerella plurivora]|uniref:2-dehydropantoate 2-reductase n=1 Tax=Plectosphaerella plurivora TaxID=936078 RepID=A0A9P8VI08_9PEZI|nr:ketopantoate reductase PanE/ApbA C terminal-domain-containing protein [Plectosphaerella plurivora]
MAKIKVLVVGTGGIGTVSAFALEAGGLVEVTAVMRSNFTAATRNGIDIDSVQYGQIKAWKPTCIVNAVPDVSLDGAGPFDYILVATKNVPEVFPTVADIIAPAVTPGHTAIVLSQNGINIEKPLTTRFPTNPLISSVAYTGATETSPAKVYHDDPDKQKIGAFTSPKVPREIAEQSAKRYVEIYNPHGSLNVVYEPDVAANRWRKLAYNSSFNPVASILRMDTPRLRMSRHAIDDLIIPIIEEIRTVAAASGVVLQEDLVEAVIHQDPIDSAFKPSMCQDYEKGNLMEIENILGEPLREGEKLGVPMPTVRIIYGIMKGLQLGIKEAKGLWEPKFEAGNRYA